MQHVAPIVLDEDAEDGEEGFAEAIKVRQVSQAGLLVQLLELGVGFGVQGSGFRGFGVSGSRLQGCACVQGFRDCF